MTREQRQKEKHTTTAQHASVISFVYHIYRSTHRVIETLRITYIATQYPGAC